MEKTQEAKNIGGVSRGSFPWWVLQKNFPGKALLVVPDAEDPMSFVDDANSVV